MRDSTLAWLSAAVYDDWPVFERRVTQRRYRVVATFDEDGTQAALVLGKRSAAIVFRGTEASRWQLRDLFSNLTWLWPTVWQGAGRVHSGYRRHFNMVAHRALRMAEETASATPLYCTGHSLGGALATLFAASYYHDNPGYRLAALVTFDPPKAMDGTAARSIGCPIRRYVVRGSFAQWWPPVLGLRHPNRALWLPPRDPTDGPLKRHDVDGYVAALRDR